MGGAVAAGCKRLDMRVVGLRRGGGGSHPSVDEMFGRDGLQDVLSQADILFVCTPLTPETHHLIGAAEIARMKPGAGLVNLARGGVADAAAVADALASGHLSGALMDVFDEEPLPAASPLWDCPT